MILHIVIEVYNGVISDITANVEATVTVIDKSDDEETTATEYNIEPGNVEQAIAKYEE